MSNSSKYDLPWIEKYRPRSLDDIIDHPDKIRTLRSLIQNNELTHLLFYGFAGTGKTSMILALAHEIYGDQANKYILELNASDDRGIDTVRKKIPDFVKSTSNKIRLVILDEVDAMTNDAQSALRRVIEKYSRNSRFCLICNNINKIIPGLRSRCTNMRFGYLSTSQISQKIQHIIEDEKVQITSQALERLININKDFRQILNTLQCLHVIHLSNKNGYQPIQADEINQYLGIPTENDIKSVLQILLGSSLRESIHQLSDIFKNNQWSLPELIRKLADHIVNTSDMKENQKYFIIDHLSDIEFKLSHSNDQEIQLYALVSTFQQSKNI